MCHASPTAELLSALCAIGGAIFITYHVYCFDGGRCLLWPRKRQLFRGVMCWLVLVSVYSYVTWGVMQTYVKYKHGYAQYTIAPGIQTIVPVPYTLWPESDQLLIRVSYHILAVAWALFVVINAEETLYWHYLIRSIRRRNSAPWFRSLEFTLLVVVSLAGFATLMTLPVLAGNDLLLSERNIFFTGSVFAAVLTVGSFWLQWAFPVFIAECLRKGVNPDVVARLALFRNLHTIRTALRVIYVICDTTLSVDAFTKAKHLNQTALSLDLLYVTGFISVFGSTMITMMILLPRNMTTEAGIKPIAPVFVRPYRLRTQGIRRAPAPGQIVLSPSSGGSSATLNDKNAARAFYPMPDSPEGSEKFLDDPYEVLGECLNLNDPSVRQDADEEIGLETGLSYRNVPAQPFAPAPGTRMLTGQELERVTSGAAPVRMESFVSPLFHGEIEDAGRSNRAQPMEVVIHTETTVSGI